MRLLKLAVADLPADDHANTTHTEWINPLHIETATHHISWHEPTPMLWLELTLSSGIVRYHLTGPLPSPDIETATEHALQQLALT